MIEIFGLSFNIIELLLIIIVAMVLITQTSWWIFRDHWANPTFVNNIQKNINGWVISNKKRWGFFEMPTIFGLISFIMILPLLFLDIMSIAIGSEILVPIQTAYRVSIPLFGSFGVFHLISTGLLVLLSCVFAIVRDILKNRNKSVLLISLFLIMSIILQSGLIIFCQPDLFLSIVPDTLWMELLQSGGLVLQLFLSMVVPTLCISISLYAFFDFIKSFLKDIMIFMSILISYIGLGLLWLLFGFQSNDKTVRNSDV